MSKTEENKQEVTVPEKASKSRSPSVKNNALNELLDSAVMQDDALALGLSNLATLPKVGCGQHIPFSIFNKPFAQGVMGFRPNSGSMKLTFACGTAQAQSIPLDKYVAMVENIYNSDRSTIVLQNHSDPVNNNAGRGQLLGRIIPQASAVVIGLGYSGRVVSKIADFVKVDVYYLSRTEMASYYIAARTQLSTENTLTELIAAYEGWCKFGIPANPDNPYELVQSA